MKKLAEYIVRGRWQAVQLVALTGAAAYLLPPLTSLLVYVAAAALALVTLYHGVLAGVQVLALASIAVVLLFEVIGQHQLALQVSLQILLLWVPAWMTAAVMQLTRKPEHALTVAALFGASSLLAVYGYFGDPVPWWTGLLQQVIAQLEAGGISLPQFSDGDLVREIAGLMTGMLVSLLLVGVLASLMLARWWQAELVRPGAFGVEFCELRMPRSFGLLTLGTLLFARLAHGMHAGLAAQLAMIMLVPFLLTGLAVIHKLVRQAGRGTIWLALVYVLLALLPQFALLLAGGGLLDTWVDFRRRLQTRRQHNKDL